MAFDAILQKTHSGTSVLYPRDRRDPGPRVVHPRLDLVPVLDRPRERDRPACIRVAQARRLEPREGIDALTRRRRRIARRHEGFHRCRPRPGARPLARDAASLRSRRDRGTDVAGLSPVRRRSRERDHVGFPAGGRFHRVLHRLDPGHRRGDPPDHGAAAAEATPAARESALLRGVPRGHLGAGGRHAHGPRGHRGARAYRHSAPQRRSRRGPRDGRLAGAGNAEPSALRPQRAPRARARRDHVNRLHALTDGVYAIAMTLLVLELHVPDARSSSELVAGLVAQAPSLFGFALSFAVLGTYWVGNAVNLSHLGRVDRAALFLNVLQLFFISLLPFTTAVVGRYPDEAAAVILYGVHLAARGLAQYAHWVYVLRNQHLAHGPIDAATARTVSLRILVGPAAWLVAIVLALFSPPLGYAVYFVVLIGYLATSVRDRTAIR